ncbi:MAG: HlyD family efflux transporter periplasmic adaptor subunit [Sphingomonadaceae bacterium]|nr:HlyD family efflux transporter periplasmic adaptor subunit [Sphingomonadaceae bacterium]
MRHQGGSFVATLAATLAVIAAAWFAAAPIEPVIDATGRLVPASGVRTLAAAEGGVLTEITAAPGARVAAGAVLARIAVPGLDAEERRAERDLALARAERARVGDFAKDGPSADRAADPRGAVDAAASAHPSPATQPRSGAIAAGGSPGSETGTAPAAPTEAAELAAARLRVAVSARALGEAHAAVYARRSAAEVAASRAAALGAAARVGLEPRATAQLAEAERSHAAAELGAALAAEKRAAATLEAARAEVVAEALRRREGRDDAGSRADLALSAAEAALDRVRARRALAELRAPSAGRVARVSVKGQGSLLGAGETIVELWPDGPVAVELEIDPARGEWLRSGLAARIVPLGRPRGRAVPGVVIAVTPTVARDGAPRLMVRVDANSRPSVQPKGALVGATVADAVVPSASPPRVSANPVASLKPRSPLAAPLAASHPAHASTLEAGGAVRVASEEAQVPTGAPAGAASNRAPAPKLQAGTPVRVLILGHPRTPWQMLVDAIAPPR